MNVEKDYSAQTAEDWALLWRTRPTVSGVVRELGKLAGERPREVFLNAAYFIGGALAEHDFNLFGNGGQPLLRRHSGDFIEEVLFRAPATGIPGVYAPIAVELHVSHRRLTELREDYWARATHAPMSVASGNLGELASPPVRLLFNLADETARGSSMRDISALISRHALPWMDLLRSPDELAAQLLEADVPMLADDVGLELLLCCRGTWAARRFLTRLLDDDLGLARQVDRQLPKLAFAHGGARIRVGSLAWNLAVIATRHGLI